MDRRSGTQRVVIAVLEGLTRILWGFRANLMADIVDQKGGWASIRFFVVNMPKYQRTLRAWGPLRTHYLAGAVSIISGCAYCAYGHLHAFQLHFFSETGNLFFIDEERMLAAAANGPEPAVKILSRSLIESDMADEVEWLQRVTAVNLAEEPATDDEKRLHQIVRMFSFLNECGVTAGTPNDEAHDPINKDRELRVRYRQAREHFG